MRSSRSSSVARIHRAHDLDDVFVVAEPIERQLGHRVEPIVPQRAGERRQREMVAAGEREQIGHGEPRKRDTGGPRRHRAGPGPSLIGRLWRAHEAHLAGFAALIGQHAAGDDRDAAVGDTVAAPRAPCRLAHHADRHQIGTRQHALDLGARERVARLRLGFEVRQ